GYLYRRKRQDSVWTGTGFTPEYGVAGLPATYRVAECIPDRLYALQSYRSAGGCEIIGKRLARLRRARPLPNNSAEVPATAPFLPRSSPSASHSPLPDPSGSYPPGSNDSRDGQNTTRLPN